MHALPTAYFYSNFGTEQNHAVGEQIAEQIAEQLLQCCLAGLPDP